MKRKPSLYFLYPLTALILLVYVLDRKAFLVPPLGTFLNPFVGAVQNEKSAKNDGDFDIGSATETEVLFDERAVPHVFAESQSDLFLAQGFVCASDRLWQMDFISYASAGRLSEIMGPEYLDLDRAQRRNGMLRSAEQSLIFIEEDAQTKNALDNYTAGVNAFIETLTLNDLPLEYKMFDYKPEAWTNLKSVLIMKYMSALLSGYEDDIASSYMSMILGGQEYDKLFSSFKISENRDSFALDMILDTLPSNTYVDYSFLESSTTIAPSNFNPRLGSNSWAVAPNKSETGNAILCSDPHLNLSFPAIWYEMQLASNEQNTYGYAIPGVPGIIVGFNESVSWGLTNGSTDVRDYYKLELNSDYSYYKYDNNWIPTEMTIEEIKIRNEESYFDTIFYSVHGPIASDYRFGAPDARGFAIDWTLHDPSNEFLTFLEMNKAKNYADFKSAIKHYQCPVQNFSYADSEGNIAIHYQGKIKANKWKDKGRFILDGTRSNQFETENKEGQLPFTYNPAEGYVLSANNNPNRIADSAVIYGHYSELRADKIDAVLANKSKFTVEDMKGMQLDKTNRLAELALPILLELNQHSKNPYFIALKAWSCDYDIDSELALVFESWWQHIKINTWDEFAQFGNVRKLPDDLVLLNMIVNEPNSPYFDRIASDEIETASDIVTYAFNSIWNEVGIHQNWGSMNTVDIRHLTNLPAFSTIGMKHGGHPNAINAISRNWGPSLRMIVEMGEQTKAYGVYAGGQSGNPGSTEYDRFVDDWANGVYYELKFFADKGAAGEESKNKWRIK
jgi:penicillin amidase